MKLTTYINNRASFLKELVHNIKISDVKIAIRLNKRILMKNWLQDSI